MAETEQFKAGQGTAGGWAQAEQLEEAREQFPIRFLPEIKIARNAGPEGLLRQKQAEAAAYAVDARGEFLPAGELLTFLGAIKGDDGEALAEALVIVSACYEDGSEQAMGYTYSGEDGSYLVSVQKPAGDRWLSSFIVRAGKSSVFSEGDSGAEQIPNSPGRKDWFSLMESISRRPNKTLNNIDRLFGGR